MPKINKKQIAVKKKTSSRKRTNAKHSHARAKSYKLLFEHIDFICWEIAEFRGNNLYTACSSKFPEYPPGKSDKKYMCWWSDRISKNFPRDRFGNPTDKCIYKEKILAYRKEYLSSIKDSTPLAHAKERLKKYEEILAFALEEKTIRYQTVKQVEYNTVKDKTDKNGNTTYKTVRQFKHVPVPIKGRNLDVARRVLESIQSEVGDDKAAAPVQKTSVKMEIKQTTGDWEVDE